MATKFTSTDPSAVVSTANTSQIDTLNSTGTVNGLIGASSSSSGSALSSLTSGSALDSQVSSLTKSVAKTSSKTSTTLSGLVSGAKSIPTSDTLLSVNAAKTRAKSLAFTNSAKVAVQGIISAGSSAVVSATNYRSLIEASVTGDYTDYHSALKDSLEGLADTGDIFALDDVLTEMESGGLDFNSLIDSVTPGLTGTILSKFDLSVLMPNVPESILTFAGSHLLTILARLTPSWYYIDESRQLYNHKILSSLSAMTLTILGRSDDYSGITELARNLNAHNTAERRNDIKQSSL